MPLLADVQPTLTSLGELSPDLQALFTDLQPLIKAGRLGFPALARVLRGIDPTPASTGPLLQQLNPILEDLETQQATLTDFFSVPPSAFGLKLDPTNESLGHALPQVIVTGRQTLPTAERTPDNRGNAYLAPGAWRMTASSSRAASRCRASTATTSASSRPPTHRGASRPSRRPRSTRP